MSKKLDEMEQNMIRGLEEKTGKSLAQWVMLAGKSGAEKHGQIVKYLKTEHGLTHGYANLVAHELRKGQAGDAAEPDLVASQYSGAKAELRPIYDAIIREVRKFGQDVELAPKKAYVSLRRSKQFGLIQPTTRTRVDLGLNLKDVEPEGRLEASGSFNAMVSHRVRVSDRKEVNPELVGWLRQAYDRA